MWRSFILLFVLSTAHAREPSVYVYNETSDHVEYQRNSTEYRPMASITKLMTAMVALDHSKDLFRQLPLNTTVRSNLPRGAYTRQELFNAMLVRSDNAAAETLANDYPGGRREFIWRMNQQAREWGINATFRDPTGLDRGNMATAGDIGTMAAYAAGYWVIRDASVKKTVAFERKFKKKLKTIQLNNTNRPLLMEFDEIIVSKTGLTGPAGYCVALVVEHEKQRRVIVVLGEKNKTRRTDTVQDIMYNHVLDQNLQDTKYLNN
jgi:serine-type D-Ala-D-Ala endopeptidase (penicillin-binding protein 7)